MFNLLAARRHGRVCPWDGGVARFPHHLIVVVHFCIVAAAALVVWGFVITSCAVVKTIVDEGADGERRGSLSNAIACAHRQRWPLAMRADKRCIGHWPCDVETIVDEGADSERRDDCHGDEVGSGIMMQSHCLKARQIMQKCQNTAVCACSKIRQPRGVSPSNNG